MTESLGLSSSVTDRVPVELHDQIIDHLQNDTPALILCSTVCRAWMRASRYHLFSSLEIGKRRNPAALHALLTGPHCTFTHVVRELSILASKSVPPEDFLRSLPGVDKLLLSATYPVPTRTVLSWTRFYADQLTELVLYAISPRKISFLPFAEGVQELRVLQHLALIGVSWDDPGPSSSTIELVVQLSTRLPPIRSIILTAESTNIFWWLLANGAQISKLDLKFHSKLQTDVGSYLGGVGESLQELDLHWENSNTIDISVNINLRALWFHDIWLSAGDWVTFILAQVTTAPLHTVTLHILTDDFKGAPARIESFDWRAFGAVIRDGPLKSSLRRLQIFWLGWYQVAGMAEELARILKQLLPSTIECMIADSLTPPATRFRGTTHRRLFERRFQVAG